MGKDSPSVPSTRHFYTDQYVVYKGMIPAAQHWAINTLACKTNHIERFKNTLRQRVSRLVREALPFSKKIREPYRRHKALHMPLQPDESCGVERAFHGHHYRITWR